AERTRSAARAIRVARVPALFPAADGRPAPRREHAARACLLPRAPALAALPADAQAHRAPVERTRPDAAGQCTDRSAARVRLCAPYPFYGHSCFGRSSAARSQLPNSAAASYADWAKSRMASSGDDARLTTSYGMMYSRIVRSYPAPAGRNARARAV